MKWIGQHIYDLASRFRDDVYLEDISSGTIASGGNLGLDSNNKIVKATGGDLSGLSDVTPTNGDKLATLDSDGSTEQLTTVASLATLFAGTGLTAASSVIGVDASQPTITTLAGLTSIGAIGVNTLVSSNDIQIYNPVNDGNPQLGIGSSATNQVVIWPAYASGTQVLENVRFRTYTTSGTADHGYFYFSVDETGILSIDDGGINFTGNKGISIDGTDILTDSSGTATLSNIDALDATTIATFETAMEANIDTLTGPIEIEQGASGGGPALLIDNDDVDQHALKLEAANTTATALQIAVPTLTTGRAIDINADALTTGSAISIDVDDALTASATKSLINIDYDKSGDTDTGQVSVTSGIKIDLTDNADDNLGTITMQGIDVAISSNDADGTVNQTGMHVSCADGDAATTVGYSSQITDGGLDFRAYSGDATTDYFAIATGANGATTLTTVDASHALAHFEVAADGDITLDSAGQIKLEPVAGNNILLDGILTVDGGTVVPVATAHDTAGTAISIGAGGTTAGTTNNIAGGDLTIYGGQGKGSGAGGDIIFKTANASEIGSSINPLATALTISDDLSATFAGTIVGDVTGDVTGDITGGHASITDLTTIGATGVNTVINSDDVQMYNPVDDGNPSFQVGKDHLDNFRIRTYYDSGAQTVSFVEFTTYTTNSDADKGLFSFLVDQVATLNIDDGGINFYANKGISIAGTDILTDSSGTATLSNIDALDATTEATIESAIDTLSNLTSATSLTSIGKLTGPVEIEQGASGGGAALLIDNDDVDQVALQINGANTTTAALAVAVPDLTTGNAININADSLTTGSAIDIDVDDALITAATRSLVKVDYDKSGVTGDGVLNKTTGLDINLADAATNHNNSNVRMIGAQIDVDIANNTGSIEQKGLVINVAADDVRDAAFTSGIELTVGDGATGGDLRIMSSADSGDYFEINCRTAGLTTLNTVDDDGEDANFQIVADGNITLDANGQIKLEPVAGNNILLDGTVTVDGGSVTGITTLGVDSVSLTAVQTSGESFVDNDTSIMTSAAIDDKINTKYASSIISFAAQASMLSSGNWIMPGKPGISSHTWNKDIGINHETNGGTAAAIPKQWAQAGVRVPFACVVDGISCIISNASGNRQATVGLFFSRAAETPVAWGVDADTAPILRIHADANNESGSYTGRPAHAEVTGSDIAMAAGDVFYPAMKLTGVTSGGNTDTIYISVNVHIKTLIA